MISAPLQPLDLAQASDIRASYSGAFPREHGCCDIVVVSYSGHYRIGGLGKPDARAIHALGQSAVIAWEPLGIILDFSDLEYTWGNDIRDILDIGKEGLGIEGLPLAIVVGPRCEKAVRSSFNWGGPGPQREWIFDEFGQAWDYILGEVADIRARYGSILPTPRLVDSKGVSE